MTETKDTTKKEAPKKDMAPRELKKNRRPSRRRERPRNEFDQRMLAIRRVTRVASGGRRFSFSVTMVIGDHKGRVGIGIGKAGDTSLAIDKAVKDAKKNMITVPLNKTKSIPHDVSAKYNSAQVMLMPAPGRGIVAGSALRDALELMGANDVNAKVISGSKNKLNIARATIKALKTLKVAPKKIEKDDKSVKKDTK
jgi:small subunit ribosomal protein S5